MIRSLWISKTGLDAQQTQLDVVSNNLANVGTTGFKRARVAFEDLLYQNVRQSGASTSQQTQLPTGLQIGTGVRTGFIVDSVAEVLRIHKDAIEPSPRLSEAQARLLARMANLPQQQRMVQLIEPAHLLPQGDLEALASLAA